MVQDHALDELCAFFCWKLFEDFRQRLRQRCLAFRLIGVRAQIFGFVGSFEYFWRRLKRLAKVVAILKNHIFQESLKQNGVTLKNLMNLKSLEPFLFETFEGHHPSFLFHLILKFLESLRFQKFIQNLENLVQCMHKKDYVTQTNVKVSFP